MRAAGLRGQTLLAAFLVTLLFLTALFAATIGIDRLSYRALYKRNMQLMYLLESLNQTGTAGAESLPRIFPWQRLLLLDPAGSISGDTGWLANASLTEDGSGAVFTRQYLEHSCLATPPTLAPRDLEAALAALPPSRFRGLANATTIIGSLPRWGNEHRLVLLVDKRDLIAEKSLGRLLLGLLFAGLYLLFGLLVAFIYLRLVIPINRLAWAVRRLRPDDEVPGLPYRNRRDEAGLLSASFAEAFRQLRQHQGRIKRFTEDALHELKSPITSLRSRVELALLSAPRDQATGRVSLAPGELDRLLADLGRTDRLLSGLNNLTAADAQDTQGHCRPVQVLQDLAAAYKELERPVLLDNKAPEKTELPVNPEALAGLVRILIDNALDFSPPGSPVRISCEADSTYCVMQVDDSGPGVPPELRDWIFDRFGSTRKDAPGTHLGLGLAIARSLVSRMGSNGLEAGLAAGASPQGGARFTLRLPRVG